MFQQPIRRVIYPAWLAVYPEAGNGSKTVCKDCKNAESLYREDSDVSRRRTMKQLAFRSLALLLIPLGLGLAAKKAEAGWGKCSKCSCPGFQGSGYTCTRGGCGHHYDSHY